MIPTARVQRGPSEAARCASTEDQLASIPSFQHPVRLNTELSGTTSRNEFLQNLRMALGNLEKGFCRPGWFSTALFPVLECAYRNSK
jgi:hypothetical protein